MSKKQNNRQLEPKITPECTTLDKDSKTSVELQNNCNCSCREVE